MSRFTVHGSRVSLFASVFGYTAYFIGLILVVAIFYSLIFFRH